MMRILKLVAINIVIVVVVLFCVDRTLAVLGYPEETPPKSAHRPNVSKALKSIEFEYQFTTNDLGIRYPQIPGQKPTGERRILLLGDSFTEGVGVEANETFGMLLEQHYSAVDDAAVRFVNGGLGGEGPPRFWRVFNDIGLTLNPDGVLICIYANDLMDTPETLTREDLYRMGPERFGLDQTVHELIPRVHNLLAEASRIIAREFEQRGTFTETVTALAQERGLDEEAIENWKQALPAELVDASDRGEFNKALLSMGLFHPHYWSQALDIDTPTAQQKYEAMVTVLDEITAVARQREIAVGLVFIPAPMQYDPARHAHWNPWIIGGVEFDPAWLTEQTEVQRRLDEWARDHAIPFLDLTPALRSAISRGGKLNFKLDGHWNADGHRVASDALASWIDGNEVLPLLPHAVGE